MPETYTPSPEFTDYKPPGTVPNWLLTTYYVGFMFYALVAIVVSAGVIYNKQKCSVYSEGAETSAIVFEVFGYITAVLSFIVLIMSIMALVFKMGFSEQIKTIYRKLEPRDFDTKFRLNQLQAERVVPLPSSNLEMEMTRTAPNGAYGDLEVAV